MSLDGDLSYSQRVAETERFTSFARTGGMRISNLGETGEVVLGDEMCAVLALTEATLAIAVAVRDVGVALNGVLAHLEDRSIRVISTENRP